MRAGLPLPGAMAGLLLRQQSPPDRREVAAVAQSSRQDGHTLIRLRAVTQLG